MGNNIARHAEISLNALPRQRKNQILGAERGNKHGGSLLHAWWQAPAVMRGEETGMCPEKSVGGDGLPQIKCKGWVEGLVLEVADFFFSGVAIVDLAFAVFLGCDEGGFGQLFIIA